MPGRLLRGPSRDIVTCRDSEVLVRSDGTEASWGVWERKSAWKAVLKSGGCKLNEIERDSRVGDGVGVKIVSFAVFTCGSAMTALSEAG